MKCHHLISVAQVFLWTPIIFMGIDVVHSVPITTETVPLSDESVSTDVPEEPVFDDATTEAVPATDFPDGQGQGQDDQGQGKSDYRQMDQSESDMSEPFTTDSSIVFETTLGESDARTDPTVTAPEKIRDIVPQVNLKHQEEILNELHTIWNFTETLNDATESDLKSSLTSLVHFTYDHVVQTPRPETLGRLKDLLRKLRYKLTGEEQEPSSRQKRSSGSNDSEQTENVTETLDIRSSDNGSQNRTLAEDIQELEHFLASPPFSGILAMNEIDDSGDRDKFKESTYNRNPSKYTTPADDAIVQKVIHVHDYHDAFPTRRRPTIAPSSHFPTLPLPQKKQKPQQSTITATTMLPFPVVSSSGLIQQSSITVQNVSGAIIPLSAEQIANSIINLLYADHTTSSPQPDTTTSSSSSLPTAPSFFPPNIQLLGEPFHPGSAYLHEGIPQFQQQQQVVNSIYSVIGKEKEDANKVQGTTTTSATTTSTNSPTYGTSTFGSSSIDNPGDDSGNAYDDIKKLIMNLIPTTMSTVLSQNTASIDEYLTTIPPSTQNDDSSGLGLYDLLNRIVISSTKEPEVELESTPAPLPVPISSLEDIIFGIAGAGNRRTTTTTESPTSDIVRDKLKNSTGMLYLDNLESIQILPSNSTSSISSSSLMTMIEDISSNMAPLKLFNGTKEGIVQVAETFNVLTSQAKIALIFSLSISILSIILGFFSIGPPIIVVGLLGILIPLALLVLFTWQVNSVKSGKTLLIDMAGLTNAISKMPAQDFTYVLKLISDAAQKYKI